MNATENGRAIEMILAEDIPGGTPLTFDAPLDIEALHYEAILARRKPIRILLVEDNPADVRLAMEALKECGISHSLSVVEDGVEAIAFLRRENGFAEVARPELILLDLNLPRKDGREVLAEIKADEQLRSIPVVVLTTSEAESDIQRVYDLHANCYIPKPADLKQFVTVLKSIHSFWTIIAKLPGD